MGAVHENERHAVLFAFLETDLGYVGMMSVDRQNGGLYAGVKLSYWGAALPFSKC